MTRRVVRAVRQSPPCKIRPSPRTCAQAARLFSAKLTFQSGQTFDPSNRLAAGWYAAGKPIIPTGSIVTLAARAPAPGRPLRRILPTVSFGTETDGSIVCPANANGVVAIKPTVGLNQPCWRGADFLRSRHLAHLMRAQSQMRPRPWASFKACTFDGR